MKPTRIHSQKSLRFWTKQVCPTPPSKVGTTTNCTLFLSWFSIQLLLVFVLDVRRKPHKLDTSSKPNTKLKRINRVTKLCQHAHMEPIQDHMRSIQNPHGTHTGPILYPYRNPQQTYTGLTWDHPGPNWCPSRTHMGPIRVPWNIYGHAGRDHRKFD